MGKQLLKHTEDKLRQVSKCKGGQDTVSNSEKHRTHPAGSDLILLRGSPGYTANRWQREKKGAFTDLL